MIKYGSLPFEESLKFFRDKINLPTRAWTDIWEGMHARAFVVAGAVQSELLSDLRESIDKAIADGTTLEEFRKDFRDIVKRRGWQYKGGEAWRTRVIYETNLRTAYQAGRYKQLTDPDLLKVRPYWRYDHSELVTNPRPEHEAWDNMVLPHDDPFWDTHYPPNGWGCQCKVHAESKRSLKRKKLKVNDSPEIKYVEQSVGTKGPSPRTVRVPEGIDPGWSYNVGQAAWGKQTNFETIVKHQGSKWRDLPGFTRADYGRPERVPLDEAVANVGDKAKSMSDLSRLMREAIGSDQLELYDPRGEAIVVGQAIVDHIVEVQRRMDGREQYFPFIPEIVEQPFEIWAGFAVNESGQVGIRKRYIKQIRADKGRSFGLVGESVNGYWIGLTLFRGRVDSVNNLRKGVLMYGREE